MARIIEHIPEPMVEEICSWCKESITLTTKYDADETPYPACGNCGDVIENPWNGFKLESKTKKGYQAMIDFLLVLIFGGTLGFLAHEILSLFFHKYRVSKKTTAGESN